MILNKTVTVFKHFTFEHYIGSLDFPCDMCASHSYDNYHVKIDRELVFVFCLECFDKIKGDSR